MTSKGKGKHAWACAGIASAFAARFPLDAGGLADEGGGSSYNCHLAPQFRRFGLQRLGWIVSKRLSQKRACFNFTFFCGIDELPNVQVLCCVKELLEQFVPELRLDGKQSYHLLPAAFL